MGITGFISHPGYGAFYESSDTCSDAGINPRSSIRLKVGHVCEECGVSVLAYSRPESCEEHD